MIAGNLRHKIEIYKPTVTKNDDYGSESIDYTLYMTLRAEKKELTASKGVDNKEVFNSKAILFVTYYRVNITTDMRVKFNDTDYQISSIKEIGFRDGLEIEVEKINK